MNPLVYKIGAGLLAVLLIWLHGRSSGKDAEFKRRSDADLKNAVNAIKAKNNQGIADDLTKQAGK